ncbi:MAG TPA: acyl-CoA reductase [Verrucomicrobiae bacterium]
MNLPNYFFADLPPEAELSPSMIAAACDTLKRNREKFLAPRSTGEMIQLLSDVAAEWLRPENQFRRLALDSGPAQTGFSKATLEKGLIHFFGQFTPENLRVLVAQEFGDGVGVAGDLWPPMTPDNSPRTSPAIHHLWRGPRLMVHVAAGNIPNPTLMSLALGLLTRSAQFVKCATGTSLLPRLFAHSIYEYDRKIGSCLELAEWRGGNEPLESALFAQANCVTATGSDETLAAIRTRLPARARFVGYGQRISFGYIAREALRDETLAELVARAADDVVAWDQNGCLSPQVIYVEERGAVESDQFAARLAAELMQREMTEPRGAISVEEAADIASRRTLYETLAAHRGDAKLWQSQNSTAWTVIFEHDVRFRFSPLNRFIFVKPVPDLAAALQGLDEVQDRVSTVGVAAPPDKGHELARQFSGWGATRICPLGQMQNPPLTWRHDGRPALGDLVAWIDLER